MRERVCPNCKNSLGEFDYYFCSLCGSKLPKEAISEFRGVRIRTFKISSVTRSAVSDVLAVFKSIETYYIFSLLVFIFFVIYGITQTGLVEFANYELNKNPQSNVQIPKLPNAKIPELALDLPSSSGKFSTVKFAELIPSESSIYFEGYDVVFISKYLTKDASLSPLFKNPSILLESGYAGFRYDTGWGFIWTLKDTEIVAKVMGDVKDSYWKFKIIGDKFVMVSDERIFAEMSEITKGTKPSLALNPEFVRRDQMLKAEGRGKIVFMTKESFDIVRNSLGGLDQVTITNINKVLGAGFDSILIK